jgi:hypothetical protein
MMVVTVMKVGSDAVLFEGGSGIDFRKVREREVSVWMDIRPN